MAARPGFQQKATSYTFPIALPIWTGKDWALVGDLCDAPADAIGGTATIIIYKGFRSYVKLELHLHPLTRMAVMSKLNASLSILIALSM